MLYTKCGSEYPDDAEKCPKCSEQISESKDETQTESKEETPLFKEGSKSDAKKVVKILGIIGAICAIIGISFLAFALIVGFETLAWDDSYEDAKLEIASNSLLTLGIKLSDPDKLDQVAVETSCGEIKREDAKIEWDIKGNYGDCSISAKFKLKKIEKQIFFVDTQELSDAEHILSGYIKKEIDKNSDEDTDGDGLSNKEETAKGTNPDEVDSDKDGLDDKYELTVSKTNPNKADTDGDGLNDYNEIILGLDPNKADSKGDGKKDGTRELSYEINKDDYKLTIKGTGNIATVNIEHFESSKLTAKTGFIDGLYNLHTDGKLSEATLVIPYTDEQLTKYGLTEDNLTIYYYDATNAKYEKVNTTIDKTNKTLTAKLKHFSMYVVGDADLVQVEINNQILFILDNSWSLYSNEQYKQYTGEEWTGGWFDIDPKLDAFDSEGKRFTITSNLIDKLDGKRNKIGLSEFRADYANALKIGSSKDKIKEKLTDMLGKFITKDAGTNITNALSKGMDEFDTKSSDSKFIVLLTDGQDSSLNGNIQKIVRTALEKNIKICAVGFGGGTLNEPLQKISNQTGCSFFSSSNVEGLDELFDNIETEINSGLVDTDEDGLVDAYLLADSGFIVNRDGFSFKNYGSTFSRDGHCYGMASFAQLYYLKKLPMSEEAYKVKDADDWEASSAYSLKGTYFEKFEPLYNYHLTTEALKYTFGYKYFDQESPSNFYTVANKTIGPNSDIRKDIEDSNLYTFIVIDHKASKSEKQAYGKFDKWDRQFLDEKKIQKIGRVSNDEKTILNAIYFSFIKQLSDRTDYSSGHHLRETLAEITGNQEIVTTIGSNEFLKILNDRLQSGDPLPLSLPAHTINAISLAQDIDNPNIYHIGVYDNNYPGEKRYVKMECGKLYCNMKKNAYYDENNVSLIVNSRSYTEDLEYYTKHSN